MAAVDVAVGIILDSSTDRVLVARRNTDDIHFGKWEFPGGKINPGETLGEALVRELKEELGIKVFSYEPFDSLLFEYPDRAVSLNFCMVTDFSGLASGLEGQVIRWVKIDDLSKLDMLDANRPVIEKLVMA